MKKLTFLGLTAASLLMLGACSSSSVKDAAKEVVSTVVQEEETETTRVLQFEQEVEGVNQEITETIVYKGDEFLTLDIQLISVFDDTIKEELQELDDDSLKELLLTDLERDEQIKKISNIEGIELTSKVDDNYNFNLNVSIDFQTVDPQLLTDLSTADITIPDLSSITPEEYINNLLENGAREISHS